MARSAPYSVTSSAPTWQGHAPTWQGHVPTVTTSWASWSYLQSNTAFASRLTIDHFRRAEEWKAPYVIAQPCVDIADGGCTHRVPGELRMWRKPGSRFTLRFRVRGRIAVAAGQDDRQPRVVSVDDQTAFVAYSPRSTGDRPAGLPFLESFYDGAPVGGFVSYEEPSCADMRHTTATETAYGWTGCRCRRLRGEPDACRRSP